MRPIAGIDIGNATTEIVLVDAADSPPRPIAWDRRPTRGSKGSRESAIDAARLLARIERRAGVTASEVVIVPQAPVRSQAVSIERPRPESGSLRVLTTECRTPAGRGVAVGRPVAVESSPDSVPIAESSRDSVPSAVILVARDPLGFRETSAAVRRWVAAGADVRGVLLAGDEARLVASRLGHEVGADLPIVDGVPAQEALEARLIAIEVAPPGGVVTRLGDPVWLSAAFAKEPADASLDDARAIVAQVAGASAAVVLHTDSSVTSEAIDRVETGTNRWMTTVDGVRRPLLDLIPTLGDLPVGAVTALSAASDAATTVGDLWAVDLDAGGLPSLRPGAVARHRICLASLSTDEEARVWPEELAATPEGVVRRVWRATSEVDAALAGAKSTPGAGDEITVLDLGGGTLDLMPPVGSAVTAAGCGDLLTTAVAAALDISGGAAEWVKRRGSMRVEDPHVATDEGGRRHFLDSPAPAGSVGWLTVPGPNGPLPFSADLVPAEWRLTRRALKRLVLVDNLARACAPKSADGVVLLVGGPAEDDELLDLLREAQPGAIFGRADVAAQAIPSGPGLGTRWAVAYGLTLLQVAGRTTPAD